MRFSTLVRDCGPIKHARQCSDSEWKAALAEGRFMTVYHGQHECTPAVALVRRHGCVNTICKLVTAKPIPAHVEEIIGLRDNEQAYDLCNQ